LTKLELNISDVNKLPEAGKKLLDFAGDIKIFAFNGGMGSGKTTFIKELSKILDSKDNFSSPTYAIVNEYISPRGKIYHFDLYRVKTTDELLDIGFEEYLYSGNYCFIEWPDVAKQLLTNRYLEISMIHNQNRYLCAQIIEQ
jgi:tRNA threonylcarbamoyladenosine biosynthesis protein TsaE